MSSSPLVSVVITCYNYGSFLAGCIGSVLDQSFKSIEIIIVNDGSTDNTDEMMQPFLDLKNLTYIKQPNSGQTVAKNTGIRHAKGEFIAFLDADDLWYPLKLEKQLPLFNNDTGVVFSRQTFIDEKGNQLPSPPLSYYLQPRRGDVREYLIFDNFIPFSSSVIKKECFDRKGLFDESLKMGIDWELWLRFSTFCTFDFVNEPLLLYRVGHSNQMSKNISERFASADRIIKKTLNHHPDFVSSNILKLERIYTYCNRGEIFRNLDLVRSFKYFIKALMRSPFTFKIYTGLIKNVLHFICRLFK